MKLLEDRILLEGQVLPGDILKVDSFLNQQVDMQLIDALAGEFYRLFCCEGVTKILTAESSGISIAAAAALHFRVPMIFAKKTHPEKGANGCYFSRMRSYTRGTDCLLTVSGRFLSASDCVLILDDFLARGSAALGMLAIVRQSGAKVAGVGVAIEKSFQDGGRRIREAGVRLESLAVIENMSPPGEIVFYRGD